MSQQLTAIGYTIAETFLDRLKKPANMERAAELVSHIPTGTTLHGYYGTQQMAADALEAMAKTLEGRGTKVTRFHVGERADHPLSFIRHETTHGYRRLSVETLWPTDSLL